MLGISMYQHVGDETTRTTRGTTTFRIFRCAYCRALAVSPLAYAAPPSKCGKCRQ